MRQLVDEVGETAAFYVREGGRHLCLSREHASRLVRAHVDEGAKPPLDRGARGRVLMAFTAGEGELYDGVRETGSYVSQADRDPEIVAIAVPVFRADGQFVGALSVTGSRTRLTPERIEEIQGTLAPGGTTLTHPGCPAMASTRDDGDHHPARPLHPRLAQRRLPNVRSCRDPRLCQRQSLATATGLRYGEADLEEGESVSRYPVLLHTAIDARDCRGLAEFYRRLLGLHYREGDEPPTDGTPDDADWLVLLDDNGNRMVTVQEKKDTVPPTWPSEDVPMQMHMDFKVPTVEDLERHREYAEQLGARLLYDRSRDAGEPLYVLADPAGHPFCLLVQ